MERRAFIQGTLLTALLGAMGLPEQRAVAGEWGREVVQAVPLGHPRVLVTNFDRLRQVVTVDDLAAGIYARAKADADEILAKPVSQYVIPDGLRLLDTSREVVRRTYSLAIVHIVEGGTVYRDRLWAELQAAASFPDWNATKHFLDTGEMTHAFALGYDWLYDDWTPSQRSVLVTAIRDFGLKPGLVAFRDQGAWPYLWPDDPSNWNIVCNSGLTLGAIAIADEEPELSAQVIDLALDSIVRGIETYGPAGAYTEGLGYWQYATKYLVPFLASLIPFLADDRGLSDMPGLDRTGRFPIYLTGPSNLVFNFADATAGPIRPSEMFWLGQRYADPVVNWWAAAGALAPVSWSQSPASLLWYDPAAVASPVEVDLPLDIHYPRTEIVSLRSGWQDDQVLFVAVKAGENNVSHSDLDLGDFVFDALGQRWASDLDPGDYTLAGYFENAPGGQRWTYYSKRPEGQNTLTINPSSFDGQTQSHAAFSSPNFGASSAFAIADLTKAHPDISSWQRGVGMFSDRQQVVVQDELAAPAAADVWWFMHTSADITVAPDGRTATLELNGDRLTAEVISPTGATFLNADARPLWTSPDPEQQPTIQNFRKLAIRLQRVTGATITVRFVPQLDGWKPPAAELTPLSEWSAGPAEVARLASITIDKEPIESFSSSNLFYTVSTISSRIPKIRAKAEDRRARVVVKPPRKVPGTATITVDGPGKTKKVRYHVHIVRAADTNSPADFSTPIISSSDDGNRAINTMDGNFTTRWTSQGAGEWIAYDMGADGPVGAVSIAWYNGSQRASRFDIEIARDGQTAWTRVFSGSGSGATAELERHTFPPTTARYLRIVGFGNTSNDYNSITEVLIEGRAVEMPQRPPYLPAIDLAVPGVVDVSAPVPLGMTGTLSDGTPASFDDAVVEYYTDKPEVATVDSGGILTPLSEGVVSVSAVVTTADHRLVYRRKQVEVGNPRRVRVTSVGDSFVRDGSFASANYGAITFLAVKDGGPGFKRQAVFRFETSGFAGPIESATISVYAAVDDTAGSEIDIAVHLLGADFDESTVTWTNLPPVGDQIGAFRANRTRVKHDVALVLTDALRAALASGMPLAVVLRQNAGGAGLGTSINSRETDRPAELTVIMAP